LSSIQKGNELMPTIARLLLLASLLAGLAGCATGPKQRINPPVASLQELAVQPDGTWQLSVRLQNYSTVATTFTTVTARLLVSGQDAGELTVAPNLTVGPESADVVPVVLVPSLAAKTTVATALAGGQSVLYSLSGRIVTSAPKGDKEFRFDSSLNPAPGLRGVMR